MKDKELRKLIGSRAKQRRLELGLKPVSYTHLDVYKRQGRDLRDKNTVRAVSRKTAVT